MMTTAAEPALSERRLSFLACVARLQQWLDSEQISYAVFGSVATSAWTDQGASLDFDRPGAMDPVERIPDIDVLVPRAALDRVRSFARTARNGDFPVSIDTFWSECWIDFRPGSQFSYLTHGVVRIPVRTEVLAPSQAWLLGQQVAVVDPRTLLHMYGVAGVARRKDRPRIAALAGALASGSLASRVTDRDCMAFGSFRRARRRRYPLFFAAKGSWVRLIDLLPPRAAQALTHHVQLRANSAFRILNRRRRWSRG